MIKLRRKLLPDGAPAPASRKEIVKGAILVADGSELRFAYYDPNFGGAWCWEPLDHFEPVEEGGDNADRTH